jgi:hypothetical protein
MGSWLRLALLAATGLLPLASAADISASRPTDLEVTIYRAPYRGSAALNLQFLEGFALITETRTLSVPAGESRVRFEGVADGIEPASAILSGLPAALLEKNRDSRLLSPSALLALTLGRKVELVRTHRKTGRTTRVTGTLRADNDGVVFESAQGIEALRCSGLPETFELTSTADLSPTPTLSVRVRTPRPLSTQVTLSYLSRGFDWTASYIATLAPDARTMDLGAWVTLANANEVSFPAAQARIVAGRLNRENGQVEPLERGAAILAQCWPQGTTSDSPPTAPPPAPPAILREAPREKPERMFKRAVAGNIAGTPIVQVIEEQLGDLKLYRVPERTTVSSLQMKQVRLLDQHDVPVELIYRADIEANRSTAFAPARRLVRTQNDTAHHLGLPLPSGLVNTFTAREEAPLLLAEAPLRDIAVGEEVEIGLGEAPDVLARAVLERRKIDPARVTELPLVPGVVRLRSAVVDEARRIEVSNASGNDLSFEAHLHLPDGTQLIRAAPAPVLRNGHQVFSFRVRAGRTASVRYQTEHNLSRLVR